MLKDKRKIILVVVLLLFTSSFVWSQSEKPSDDSHLYPLNISDNDQTKEGSMEVDFVLTSNTVSPQMIVGYNNKISKQAVLQIFNNDNDPERLILKINDEAEDGWIMGSVDAEGRAEWMDPEEVIDNSGLYIGSNIWKKDENNRVSLIPNINKLAIGPNLAVNGDNSVAIGRGVGYTGIGALAISSRQEINSYANGLYSVLISSSSKIQRSLGHYSVVISSQEKQSIANGQSSLILGSGSINGDYSVSLMGGDPSSVSGDYSVYMMGAPESRQDYVLAIGDTALAVGESSVSISTGSGENSSTGQYSTIIGTNDESANVTGMGGTAILNKGAQLAGRYSSIIGSGSVSLQGMYALAISGGDVRSRYATAIGSGSVAQAESSTAISLSGTSVQTFGRYSSIFQAGNHSSSVNGIASTIIATDTASIGSSANYSTVIGSGTVQSNTRSALVMAGGVVKQNYSTAIGSLAETNGMYSLSIKLGSNGILNAKDSYTTAMSVSSESSTIDGLTSTAILIKGASIEDGVEHSTVIGFGDIQENGNYGTAIWGGRIQQEDEINGYATAIGHSGLAKGIGSTAIGLVGNVGAYGDYSTIMSVAENESTISAPYSTALLIKQGSIGEGAENSTVIGWGDVQENTISAVAMMGGNAGGNYSLAIGENSVTTDTGWNGVAIGRGASIKASGESSTIIATHGSNINSEVFGRFSVAILNKEGMAWGDNSVVIGSGETIGEHSVVIGGGKALAPYSLVIQNDDDVPGTTGEKSISIKGYEASGSNSVAVMYGEATGTNAVAIGAQALASGLHSTSITPGGTSHQTRVISSGSYSVAMGRCQSGSSIASGIGSVVLTGGICPTTASGNYSTALSGGIATQMYATAMLESTASGLSSVALGQSTASGAKSVALRGAKASGVNSVAMKGGEATSSYSMAVGYGIKNDMVNSFLTYGLRVQDGKVTVSEDNSYNNWVNASLHVIGDMKADEYETQLQGSPWVTYHGVRSEEKKAIYVTGSGQLNNGTATFPVPEGMTNPSVYVYSLSEGRDIIGSVSGQTITIKESSIGSVSSNPSASFNYIVTEKLD
jgi:trimeric autotransporter adhesin